MQGLSCNFEALRFERCTNISGEDIEFVKQGVGEVEWDGYRVVEGSDSESDYESAGE